MWCKILADLVLVIHFVWIMFMLSGFLLTVTAFCRLYLFRRDSERWNRFLDRWFFRTFHLCGIIYIGLLAILGKYCPLTLLENTLRAKYNPEMVYPGSFIIYYLEKLVYPSVHPLIILIPTIAAALLTIIAYIFRPPKMIGHYFRRLFC